MRAVKRPGFDATCTYLRCTSRVKNVELRQRFQKILTHISYAALEYSNRARNAQLHLINQSNDVAGVVTGDEMVGVYNQRMVLKDSPGREIYDALKLLPELGVCPFCDHGMVSTLDHILPKSLFPKLVVAPDNLVGACRDCNQKKAASAPTCEEEVPFHPYFDNLSSVKWLDGQVIRGEVASVMFCVRNVVQWPSRLNARVRRQFEELELGLLYASQAAREISGLRMNMDQIFSAGGARGVQEELIVKSRSWEKHSVNCWQAVTYKALSESDWYCNGGFNY